MKYSIIHHPSREINPSIMRELDKVTVYTDLYDEGCTAMHLRALADAEEAYEPTVIIEDDAILCHRFADLAKYYYDVVLGKSDYIDAVSFYLGQGAPVHMQEEFRSGIAYAESTGKDFIELGNLYHAVCYVVWTPRCRELVDLNPQAKMIDELLSTKLHKVAYAWPCLADHDENQPSIVEHEGIRPTVPRVAWGFRG
jgi:hypothetical protein